VATRYFTLDEAQALVPRVRTLLGQALQLHGHLRIAIARLSEDGYAITWAILRGEDELATDAGEDPPDAQTEQEAEQALERARMIYRTLREIVGKIEALGAEVKAVVDGLVDFRSWCDGEHEVVLCWKLGEAEIRFFHGLEEGFAGRRSISGHRFTSERALEHAQRQ
jgi:hypothetical protein